jgi:hypothetical protein
VPADPIAPLFHERRRFDGDVPPGAVLLPEVQKAQDFHRSMSVPDAQEMALPAVQTDSDGP